MILVTMRGTKLQLIMTNGCSASSVMLAFSRVQALTGIRALSNSTLGKTRQVLIYHDDYSVIVTGLRPLPPLFYFRGQLQDREKSKSIECIVPHMAGIFLRT
jgi:hypothetical protein